MINLKARWWVTSGVLVVVVVVVVVLVVVAWRASVRASTDGSAFPADPQGSVAAAVYLSFNGPETDSGGNSSVALIAPDGAISFVDVDKTTGGELAFGSDGALFVPSARHTYLMDDGVRTVTSHPERISNSLVGQLRDGVFAALFADGVFISTQDGTTTPAGGYSVDAEGIDDSRVYVRSDDPINAVAHLNTVNADGSSGRSYQFSTWGAKDNWSVIFSSSLFSHDGKLYFLEDVAQHDSEHNTVAYDGEHRSQVRLSSLDLATGAYASRFSLASTYPNRITGRDDYFSMLAQSSVKSALLDSALWWLDQRGRIMSTSLESAESTVRCQLPERITSYDDFTAEWTDGTLTLLATRNKQVTLYRVDLATCAVSSMDIPAISDMLENHRLDISDLALNPRLPLRALS